MMPCPAGVQYVPVSTVARPVTVTADAEVKNAGMKPAEPSPEWANGSRSRIVPTTIKREERQRQQADGVRDRSRDPEAPRAVHAMTLPQRIAGAPVIISSAWSRPFVLLRPNAPDPTASSFPGHDCGPDVTCPRAMR